MRKVHENKSKKNTYSERWKRDSEKKMIELMLERMRQNRIKPDVTFYGPG